MKDSHESEEKAAVMDRQTAEHPRSFRVQERVQIDASVQVLNGQDTFDVDGLNSSGGKGRWIPPTEVVSVRKLRGTICAEPYYSDRHKDLVYPVMEDHPSGGLMGVPQKALRRQPSRSLMAGFNRLYARGWNLVFGRKQDKEKERRALVEAEMLADIE